MTEALPKPTLVPVAILIRVSTDRQETVRQLTELQNLADQKGWQVVEVCEETITGSADVGDRLGLRRVEGLAQEGRIRKVLVHEVSRLSRRPSVAHSFVEMLEGHGVSLYWHAQNIETLLPSGKRSDGFVGRDLQGAGLIVGEGDGGGIADTVTTTDDQGSGL